MTSGEEKAKEVEDVLKPFYERASEAEERLARLEAVVAKKDAGNTELSSVVKEFQSELDKALDELKLVREKASKEIEQLKAEKTKIQADNAKLQYQVIHLIRAVREADAKLGS